MPPRTSVYTSSACVLSFDGSPDLNEPSSPVAAADLIFDADMPSTPSASGSRSPAEITSIDLKAKSFPLLYLFNNVSNSVTRSCPTTSVMTSYLPVRCFITSMIVFAFNFWITFPNANFARYTLSSYDSGFFFASWVWLK